MQPATIAQLNALNRAFYATTAPDFDATRQQAWAGWARLLPMLPDARPLRVLDVGCGNGRLALFLAEYLGGALTYHGLDNSDALLTYARDALNAAHINATLTPFDLTEQPLPAAQYDFVALFGVIHHVAGASQRRALMAALGERVARGGLLAWAAWRFYEVPRLRERITDWLPDLEREDGDYLLDWRRGERALRYCHHVNDAEHDALAQATALPEISRYRADGKDGQTNQYSLHRAPLA